MEKEFSVVEQAEEEVELVVEWLCRPWLGSPQSTIIVDSNVIMGLFKADK